MNNLNEKTAIVTGASSGIGAATAKYLANEGVNVVLAARRQDKLERIVKLINEQGKAQAIPVVTDVSNQGDVSALVAKAKDTFGNIDIYVNNAGAVLSGSLRAGDVEAWETMIDVNIKGVLYGIHAVLPNMLKRSEGHIINISSVSGHEVTKTSAVYSATKYAVRALSMSMEKELAKTGVRVTNISPGMVNTEIFSGDAAERKPLEPDDIARAIVYALKQPNYVNVNEIIVRPV
ncbi:SDR family oxidoreductase [Lentibacillus sp. N15]|uniref:SDR family oxidoreductase n=1 Tax=Lentibacillus songyuanensis TaxID=3136161 RepID=UPI0031BA728D